MFWKILALVSTSVLVLFLATVLVSGAFQREASITVEVVSNVEDLNFYADASMATPTSGFLFANIKRGSSESHEIWIRNDGVEPLVNLVASIQGAVAWATFNLSPLNVGTLNSGEYEMLTLTITVPLSTNIGTYTGVSLVVNN